MRTLRIRKVALLAVLLSGVGLSGQDAWASYASYIAGTNPVGWWGMNETGGTALVSTADLSGAFGAANNGASVALNMTYNNPGVMTSTDQPGYVSGAGNRATMFNGNPIFPGTVNSGATTNGIQNQTAGTGPTVYLYPSGFSAEVWIKASGSPVTISDSERVIAGREWNFGFTNGGNLHFTTVARQDYFGGGPILDNLWHQIGFSFDGNTTTQFFIDGLPAGTSTGTNPGYRPLSASSNTFNLGRRRFDVIPGPEGQQFQGLLDEAVIWNVQRTAADFAASFAAAQAEAAVPEPSTLVLFGVGALAMLGFIRRQKFVSESGSRLLMR